MTSCLTCHGACEIQDSDNLDYDTDALGRTVYCGGMIPCPDCICELCGESCGDVLVDDLCAPCVEKHDPCRSCPRLKLPLDLSAGYCESCADCGDEPHEDDVHEGMAR